jgi:hypothetical protein
MTAADLRELEVEWVDPICTTYRGWDVYELPPNTQGIAALMMLNLMEQFPLGEYGFHSAPRAARDDRGEEARLCRHAAVRRRHPVLGRSGASHAGQGTRETSGQAHRRRRCGARRAAVDVRRPDDLVGKRYDLPLGRRPPTATSSR